MAWSKSNSEFNAWAAGAFEIGGSISPARCSLQTTDKEITGDLERSFGGSTKSRMSASLELPDIASSSKTTYTWMLTGEPAIQRFLQTLLPYMHPKRVEEARDVLTTIYQKERRANAGNN